jgi:hypothetical protein
MNFKSLSLSVIAALAISAAPAYAITDAQQATLNQTIAAQASMAPAELVALLIGQTPELAADIVTSVIAARPCPAAVSSELQAVCGSVADVVQAAIAAAPEYTDAIVAAAITAAPNAAAEIVAAAVAAGADATDVVTAAVAAGADPTIAAEASAAGPNVNANANATTNTRRVSTNSGSGVSPS